MTLRRLIYSSQAVKLFTQRELLDLLHESRGYNFIDNISGVLMHKEGYFLQVIEGEPVMIHNLFKRIEKDPRHKELTILHDCTIEKRLFSNWNMGCTNFDDPQLSMLPGLKTDLTKPEVIEELIMNLPDVANILKENFLS